MAEFDDEREAGRAYRQLPREEPPRRLDDAIRAEARRAVEARPAPLVPPTGRRRWYFPIAAAAIIMLAVAVTVHVEREQADPVVASAPVPMPQKPDSAAARQNEAAPQTQTPQQPARDTFGYRKDAPRARQVEPPAERRAEIATTPAAPAAPVEEPKLEAKAGEKQAADQAMRESAPAVAGALAKRAETEAPEQALERIARLRAEGKHEEADRALAEFRRRHPDFRLSDEMRKKVER